MMYVVLGMHKSGTTLISEILHKSGIEMVENYDPRIGYDRGNRMERAATRNVNLDILNCHGQFSLDVSSQQVPNRLTDAQQQAIKAIIDENEARDADWGFKDPRTCLTYHLWESHLPSHKLIAVYRNPAQVMNHYRTLRKPWRTWEALRAWTAYNQRILDILTRTEQPYLLLSYEHLMETCAEFERLEAFADRSLVNARRMENYRNLSGSDFLLAITKKFSAGAYEPVLEQLRHFRKNQ